MSFSIEPKGRDFRLRINGVGYQTLNVADCRSLVDDLKKNPHSVDLKGVQLFLRHDEEKCAELRTVLENAIGAINEEPIENETFVDEEE